MTRKFRLREDFTSLIPRGSIGTLIGDSISFPFNDIASFMIPYDCFLGSPHLFEEITPLIPVWQKSDNCWAIHSDGTLFYTSRHSIKDEIFNFQWFSSREQAAQFSKHGAAASRLREAIESVNIQNNWTCDFSNHNQAKLFFGLDEEQKAVTLSSWKVQSFPSCYYFSEDSYDLIIKELGGEFNAIELIKDFLMIN